MVLSLAALRLRARVLLALSFLAACGVTWHALGASAAVVEGAAVGAVMLASRRRGLVAQGRSHAALAAALPDALDLLAACVEAGAMLDRALAAVAPHAEGGLGARLALVWACGGIIAFNQPLDAATAGGLASARRRARS